LRFRSSNWESRSGLGTEKNRIDKDAKILLRSWGNHISRRGSRAQTCPAEKIFSSPFNQLVKRLIVTHAPLFFFNRSVSDFVRTRHPSGSKAVGEFSQREFFPPRPISLPQKTVRYSRVQGYGSQIHGSPFRGQHKCGIRRAYH